MKTLIKAAFSVLAVVTSISAIYFGTSYLLSISESREAVRVADRAASACYAAQIRAAQESEYVERVVSELYWECDRAQQAFELLESQFREKINPMTGF